MENANWRASLERVRVEKEKEEALFETAKSEAHMDVVGAGEI